MKRKLLFFVLISWGLISPLSQVKAFFDPISAGVAYGINAVLGLALLAISSITALWVIAASAMLNWVLYSLPFKYTSGGIIDVGWPLVRDLTNMLFVIILVFIGLAVALRLKDYEAKKTLVPLVIIALLINFTPVIIGLVVDASNIVMNFFLQDINPGAYWESHLSMQKAIMPSSLLEGINPLKQVELTVAASMLIFMNLVVFAVIYMFAMLFLIRYLAIWVLVILSPIAFAAYILPATRKYWSQWWNQLFQWCIIGIVAGFFLYLGSHMFEWLETENFAKKGVSLGIELSTKLIPLVMIIIFYIIGLMTAFSTSAMGAKQITAGFKRGYKAAGITLRNRAATGAWTGTKAIGKGAGEAIKALPQSFAQGVKAGGGWKTRSGWAGGFKRAKQTATPPPPKQWLPLAKGYIKYRGTPAAKVAKTAIWSAVKDSTKAGWGAAWGLKRKGKKGSKKGTQICPNPNCNAEISAKAKACPKCGENLE